MLDIRKVTAVFSVAPQVSAGDFVKIAAAGYGAVLNNRPDEEIPGGLVHRKAEIIARKAGLSYAYIPVRVRPPDQQSVLEMEEQINCCKVPLLAWCRSGTRSIYLWAMAQLRAGRLSPEAACTLAQGAGYDLSVLFGDPEI